ncbi:toxic anion resistance protein [Dysgonomonas macrotermitis]|uniref:Uncharacterized conserved protein YaaN involved in tellurite resistance n=1 Tax=Dysgonomonas macrotermitis TaxID=1346286 RepID=A0A1M5EKH9_9BACT|nr:toxic anion resistance protein [Dysgonomonas macrotermitis]SHF79581.1 Uncharacterized conserved protein YaaN involved in tellurite resistance [Dysgonomonas macrotermitis]
MEDVRKLTVLGDDLIEKVVDVTPEYQQRIDTFKSRIDLNNTSSMQYGIASQYKLGSFSEAVLKQMRSKDAISIDTTLSTLVDELKKFDKSISRWKFKYLFESNKKRIVRINSEYKSIESTVAKIELQIEKQYQTLAVDLKLLEKMFFQNKECFEELSLYIYAGELLLKKIKETQLPLLKSDPAKQYESSVLEEQSLRLERRIHNLRLSKVVAMQLASQIRLIQSNNTVLLDKLQSCLVNTLPLWRNQMILSLNVANSQQALEAQQTITRFVNKVLRRNSKTLRRSTHTIAREGEQGVVSLYSLQRINNDLLTSVYDVLNVQQEARRARGDAENQLLVAERELSQLASGLQS